MIADFHNDVLTAAGGDLQIVSKQTAACVCAAFGGGKTFAQVNEAVMRLRAANRRNLYLSLEDAHYLDAETIDAVCAWRPVCAALTWNGENALAGGCLSGGGMTMRGRAMAKKLAGAGIALDCAHLNARSFCDLLECVSLVVDSHTCLNGVHRHPRNLDDWQVREIAARGGLIGIAFVGRFLCGGYADAEAVFRHFDYGVQKFGADCFCCGTDFFGTEDVPRGLEGYPSVGKLRELFLKAGYSDDSADALMFGNLCRFLQNGAKHN